MTEDLTSGTVVDDAERAGLTPKAEFDAPWGYKPDGTAYKRDPEQMRNVRAARFSGGRSSNARPAQPKTAKPAAGGRPATKSAVDTKKTAAYGAAAARWFMRGSDALIKDPIERGIMRRQAVDLALVVDKLLQEDARLLAWIDRLKLRLAGGAKGELLVWTISTGMLFALHRGYKHPMLELAFRSTLDQITVDSVQYERTQEQERQQMLALIAEYEREEKELLAQYGGEPVHPNGSSVLAQFAGGEAPA